MNRDRFTRGEVEKVLAQALFGLARAASAELHLAGNKTRGDAMERMAVQLRRNDAGVVGKVLDDAEAKSLPPLLIVDTVV